MSWAETFKINSDMNTPLDKLIRSQRTYGASDAVLAVLLSAEKQVSGYLHYTKYLTLAKFVSHTNGSMRVRASIRRPSGSEQYAVLVVKKGSNEILRVITDWDISASVYQDIYGDIAIEDGETYEICIGTEDGKTAYINSLKLCASIIDTSMIEYSTEV